MLQDQPEEIRAGYGSLLHPSGLGVAITKAHLTVSAGNDVFLANDAPVEITPEVDQRRLAAANQPR